MCTALPRAATESLHLNPEPCNSSPGRKQEKGPVTLRERSCLGPEEVGVDSSLEALGEVGTSTPLYPFPPPNLVCLGTDSVLTSRTEPAGRGRRSACASGTWASHRQPGRRACSSRLLCSVASRAERQDSEGGNLCPSCLLPQPPLVPEVGACLPAPVGDSCWWGRGSPFRY